MFTLTSFPCLCLQRWRGRWACVLMQPSSGIMLLYLLSKSIAFRTASSRSSVWLSNTQRGLPIYWLQQRLRCKRTGGHGWSFRQPWKKCQVCIQLYKILITCEGESKISPSNFSLFSLNQNKLAWQPKANWIIIKAGMKMKHRSVPLFYINVKKKEPNKLDWGWVISST